MSDKRKNYRGDNNKKDKGLKSPRNYIAKDLFTNDLYSHKVIFSDKKKREKSKWLKELNQQLYDNNSNDNES